MRRLLHLLLLPLLWLALHVGAGEVTALPPLTAHVNDLTGTLDAAQQAQLEASLKALELRKGAQVAVLLIASTQPEAIEAFGIRLAEAWKLGRKGVDDGLIVIVAKDDRRVRIEVGYGLEGVVPDAVAKRIIAEDMAPYFRKNDYNGGLRVAVERIVALIDGEALPAVAPAPAPSASESWGDYFGVALVGVFILGALLRAALGRLPGAAVCGGIAFAGAWLLLGSLLAGGVIGVIAFIFTLAGLGSHGSHGGFGGGSGWGGGGGMSSGGFSGGGGGFGGGGSSGNW